MRFADISAYQPSFDSVKYRASSPLIALKATEGTDYVDKPFKARWQNAGASGLVRIAYHFAHVNEDRPKGEADHFFNTVKAAGLRRGDILCLDAERGTGTPREARLWMGTFLAHLDARYKAHTGSGRKAWIYGGAWLREHLSPGGVDRYLWLAAYVNEPDQFVPAQFPKRDFVAWQFTDNGWIDGLRGVDVSEFRGSRYRLARVAGLTAAQTVKLVATGHV